MIVAGVLAHVGLVVVTQVHVARDRHVDVAASWLAGLVVAALTFWLVPGVVVAGEEHGVHAFVVELRDAEGNLRPGVRIEDCGEKMGLNGVDNGRLWFDNVRVPREALLNRYGEVREDGTYHSSIENPNRRFFTTIGALVRVFWTKKGEDRTLEQVQVVSGGNGYAAQNMRRLHFGLGEQAKIEKVVIQWPSGRTETRTGLAVNRPAEVAALFRAGHIVGLPLAVRPRRPLMAGQVSPADVWAAAELGVPVIPVAVIGGEMSGRWRVFAGEPVPAPRARGPLGLAELADGARHGVQALLDEATPPRWLLS